MDLLKWPYSKSTYLHLKNEREHPKFVMISNDFYNYVYENIGQIEVVPSS